MALSMYHSATGEQSPHCLHVVGIGRTGAGYVDGLLRTGEVEDLLEDPKARFAALVVDIGEDDMIQAKDYADAFVERLNERGIPPGTLPLSSRGAPEVPERNDLFGIAPADARIPQARVSRGTTGIPTTSHGCRRRSSCPRPEITYPACRGQGGLRESLL